MKPAPTMSPDLRAALARERCCALQRRWLLNVAKSHSRRIDGLRHISAVPPIAPGKRTWRQESYGPGTDLSRCSKSSTLRLSCGGSRSSPSRRSISTGSAAPYQRDALRLAILPLIQVATLPRLMMRTPEHLALTRPRSMLLRHLVLSICKSTARTDRVRQLQNRCARNGRIHSP